MPSAVAINHVDGVILNGIHENGKEPSGVHQVLLRLCAVPRPAFDRSGTQRMRPRQFQRRSKRAGKILQAIAELMTAGEKKPAALTLQELGFSLRVNRALSLLSGLERALVAQANLLTQIFQQDTPPAQSSVALLALPRGSCCQSRCSRHFSANVQRALSNVKAVAANTDLPWGFPTGCLHHWRRTRPHKAVRGETETRWLTGS